MTSGGEWKVQELPDGSYEVTRDRRPVFPPLDDMREVQMRLRRKVPRRTRIPVRDKDGRRTTLTV